MLIRVNAEFDCHQVAFRQEGLIEGDLLRHPQRMSGSPIIMLIFNAQYIVVRFQLRHIL